MRRIIRVWLIAKVYGDLYRIPRDQLLHLGWILRGLDSESIGQLRPDDPDLVAALGSTDFHLDPHKVIPLMLGFYLPILWFKQLVFHCVIRNNRFLNRWKTDSLTTDLTDWDCCNYLPFSFLLGGSFRNFVDSGLFPNSELKQMNWIRLCSIGHISWRHIHQLDIEIWPNRNWTTDGIASHGGSSKEDQDWAECTWLIYVIFGKWRPVNIHWI